MPSWIKLMLLLAAWLCALWNYSNPWAFAMSITAALTAFGWWLDDCDPNMFAFTEIMTYQAAQEWDSFAGRARAYFKENRSHDYFADGLPQPSSLIAIKGDDGCMIIFRVCEHEQIKTYSAT